MSTDDSKNSKKDPLSSVIGDSRTIISERPLALQSSKDSTFSDNNEAKSEDTPEHSAVQIINSQAVNLPVQPVSSPGVKVPVQADELSKPSTPPKSISIKSGLGQEVIRNPFLRQKQVGSPVARISTRLTVASMQWQPSNEQSSLYMLPQHITYSHCLTQKDNNNMCNQDYLGQMGTSTSASWRSQQSQNSYYTPQANGFCFFLQSE